MKPAIAVLALFLVACGGSSDGSGGPPTAPGPPTSSVDGGQWFHRAELIEPLSELAMAEVNRKIYLLGGYPASRQTARTVQVYDISANEWTIGPPLPQPNNHGMAAGVNGKIYLIGGQPTDLSEGPYVDTVYELDPARGTWTERARMPTARSSGVAVVHDGLIYVAGGRPPRGSDFAVYDPLADRWETLPDLPSQRNHLTGAAINGRIHVVGGRLGQGLSALMTPAHEVFDTQSRSWATPAAPMLRARSGMNGVMARGCFHVWGGEGPSGMFPDHDYYDHRSNQWIRLRDMSTPVHGVYGSAYVDGLIWASGGGTNIGGNHGSLHNQVFMPSVSCE
jgi:N-acetylneuraminic acid mutarotase